MSLIKIIIVNNKRKMKKFDIEEAKSGKPVCTRDGRPVRILCYDFLSLENTPIIALVKLSEKQEAALFYTPDGREGNHNLDLMMVGEKRKVWVNVYSEYSGSPVRSFGGLIPYATEEEAKKNIGDPKNYITTVPVEWEE